MKQLLLALILFLSVATTAFCQSTTDIILTGHVFDNKTKLPLVGATVLLKNTITGMQTDFDGVFRFAIKNKDSAATIVAQCIGFELQEFQIGAFKRSKTEKNVVTKDIFLNEDTHILSEVVVVGYSTALKKRDISDCSTCLRSSDMERIPTKPKTGSSSALAGKIAGVASTSATKPRKKVAGLPSESLSKSDIEKVAKHFFSKAHEAVLSSTDDLIPIPKASIFLQETPDLKENEPIKGKKMDIDDDDDIEPEPSAGQLTAGEWSDLKNWAFWKKSLNETFKIYINNWKINLTQRYSLILRGASEQPISDATVQLMDKNGLAIWSAKTDNNGRAELFSDVFEKTNAQKISVQWAGKIYNLDKIKNVETGVNELKIPVACDFSPMLDIAFVVDATGSMGDEIRYLKSELADVIRQVKQDNRQLGVRLGSVFYRDFRDAYVTRTFPFDKSLKKNIEFIKNQSADGGGDTPEAVPEGLEAAIDSMAWSEGAVARLLFLVLDAPPHLTTKDVEKLHRLVAKAAQKGIRIIPIASSGVDQNTEYLMKVFAIATGGTYTFLTDDSGIGGEHLKATTEKHEIELLNALLTRLIKQYSNYAACNELALATTTGGNTKLGANVNVFPNPVHDVLNLNLKTAVTDVFITNAQGQTVQKLGVFTEGVQSIDVSNLPSGVYFVHFQNDGLVCTQKITVVK